MLRRTNGRLMSVFDHSTFLTLPDHDPQVDNRIRFGLSNALKLNILKPGSTVIAVQGWKGGLGHTNTLRILSVPTDSADLEMQPLSGV